MEPKYKLGSVVQFSPATSWYTEDLIGIIVGLPRSREPPEPYYIVLTGDKKRWVWESEITESYD